MSAPQGAATTSYVVDASVAVKWFLPEIHSAAARRLLSSTASLLVPDLVFSEVGNILWKRTRLAEPSDRLTPEEAQATLSALGSLPLQVHPSWPLVLLALEIACRSGRTVYDSLYLALSVRQKALLVTADERLFNAIQTTPLSPQVLWVGDV